MIGKSCGSIIAGKLHACAFGIAYGVTEGLCLMLFAWASMQWGIGVVMMTQISEIYPGYTASFLGGIYGFGYGLLIGFIFGFLVGVIYNLCVCCCHCGTKCGSKGACTCKGVCTCKD